MFQPESTEGLAMNYTIHFKEKLYFGIMCLVSLPFYVGLLLMLIGLITMAVPTTTLVIYGVCIAAFLALNLLGHIYFIGHLRGNGIKVNQKQFPEVYDILKSQSEKLGLKTTPTMYLLQGSGMLNAFATRFVGHNYVILFSDVLAAAYQEGIPAVKFIIGHELGHIKRNHVSTLKSLFLFPAKLTPFLSSAYSRACEYTCDNIGYNLCPEGAQKGMLILAAGNNLYQRVNVSELLITAQNARGFSFWFAEVLSTHPHAVNRIAVFEKLNQKNLPLNSFVLDKDREAVQQFSDRTL